MTTVLLTDPEQRATLAAARALEKRGFRVAVAGASRGLAGVSRACAEYAPIRADLLAGRASYLAAIQAAVSDVRADVVLPITDVASRALLGQHELLGVPVAGPTMEAYSLASDKAALLGVAAQVGISVPRQVIISQPGDLVDASRRMTPPLVIKPGNSVVDIDGRAAKTAVQMVDTESDFAAMIAAYPAEVYPLLLQERTIGDGVGIFLLRSQGRTLLKLGHRRLREKPPSGGVSTYREAVAPPDDLTNKCEQLLDRLGYEGAAMIEFKQDHRSEAYLLMEINARLWGSLQLATDAGVDFASGLVDLALGNAPPPPDVVRWGTRTFWELGELDHAITLARRSRTELSVPDSTAIGILAALRTLFDHRAEDHSEVFRWSDPLPFAAELLRWARRV